MPKQPPGPRKCSKCDNPAIKGQSLCSDHFAEYMRDYRSRADRKRDQANGFRGFEQGVEAAISYLDKRIGDRAVTGREAARLVKRDVTNIETGDQQARRKLLEMLRKPFESRPVNTR
jgi:predicted nucleic acid-binding Zn ribbon protein